MSTTTIRMPQALRERVARTARRTGTTVHGFILDAIAEKAEQEERHGQFVDLAERRFANIVASGKSIPWKKMRADLQRRLAGQRITRPKRRAHSG